MRPIILFMSIVFILFGCSSKGYDTLQEAVQSKWDYPIQVLNQDEENQVVVYLDKYEDDFQYVVGLYQFDNNRYSYNHEPSEGHGSSAGRGYPIFVKPVQFEGVKPILYGAVVTEEHVATNFVIHYTNGQSQEISAKNNTIITEYPSFITQDIHQYFGEMDNVIAYDENGEVIASWR
ncbi:hypothetical protein [Halalkalibacter flavus]|uniref:hypothetical protein n=1 Tax=Halalkalibacter flavus TaxID=3090668 RepID=UPI002FCB1F2F